MLHLVFRLPLITSFPSYIQKWCIITLTWPSNLLASEKAPLGSSAIKDIGNQNSQMSLAEKQIQNTSGCKCISSEQQVRAQDCATHIKWVERTWKLIDSCCHLVANKSSHLKSWVFNRVLKLKLRTLSNLDRPANCLCSEDPPANLRVRNATWNHSSEIPGTRLNHKHQEEANK